MGRATNLVTVSARGSVVIPKDLRERYGLKKGDKIHFIDYGGSIALVPVSKDPIHESFGMLKGKTSLTEALLKSRREDAAREERTSAG